MREECGNSWGGMGFSSNRSITRHATKAQLSRDLGLQNGALGLSLHSQPITLQSERPPLAPLDLV